jgi:hypothetical protein
MTNVKLKKRLMVAKPILIKDHKKRFGTGKMDYKKKRLVSDDGKLCLQWYGGCGGGQVGIKQLVLNSQM